MGAKGTAVAGLRKPSLYLSTDVEAQPSACLAAKFNTTYLSHSFRSTFVPGLVIPERSYTHACEIANRNYDTVAPTTSIWECCFVHLKHVPVNDKTGSVFGWIATIVSAGRLVRVWPKPEPRKVALLAVLSITNRLPVNSYKR